MTKLLVFPDPAPPEVAQALDIEGHDWDPVSNITAAQAAEPDTGWRGAIIVADRQPDAAFELCRELRRGVSPVSPILLLVNGRQIGELSSRYESFDEFMLTPFHPTEFEARLRRSLWQTGSASSKSELIEYGPLRLNVETYQAKIGEEEMQLTFMEYELLRYLASNPGKVFSREVLLSQVWGYDYFGGARTVDVHIRRLRAKLGDNHAALIQTVRSVGYSFGESRWAS